ncbi:16S rRNA methyltransferase [Bdellovibrio sp. qaytius]|nr:16S rRNA methyltransferase [Bdellovibrio sp. qaytius]
MVQFVFATKELETQFGHWQNFINENFKPDSSKGDENYKVNFDGLIPTIFDHEGRKFKIDFLSDNLNYNKVKSSVNKEPLAKALGSGQKGFKLLDLSAGLGVDAVFLHQLGFKVTAVERNPLVYMALKIASEHLPEIEFIYSDSLKFLETVTPEQFDVAYFDPMFPEKKKSALPKQEMVFFKNLVGFDEDAVNIVNLATDKKLFKRFVVKRPLSAESFKRPAGSIEGKIIRYDIYGL